MDREKIEHEIDRVRSKYGEKVLNLLAKERSMYHGDMAVQLDISPSGLNAVIKKIRDSEIPLINVEQVGKFKKYSLTDEMREYMHEIASQSHRKKDNSYVEDEGLFIPIQRFVQVAEVPWRETWNRLLCDGGPVEISPKTLGVFNDLMRQMGRFYSDQGEDSAELKLLYKFIDNEVLEYLIKEYLQASQDIS